MKGRINKAWVILIFAGVLNLIIFGLRILSYPETMQVQYTPDDGYYYLTLARNFAELGRWTFDAESVTSGFHLLFAYCLALLYKIFSPGEGAFAKTGIVLTAVATLAALFPLIALYRERRMPALAVACLIITSVNFVFNSVSVMEWPLVLLFSSMYFYRVYRMKPDRQSMRADYAVLFLLGLGGSLSRSDFGLLPFSLFLACIVYSAMGRTEARRLAAPLFAGLAGASLGVLLVFAHNYIFTGHLLQSSAVVKAFWSRVLGNSAEPFLAVIMSLAVPNPYALLSRPKLLLPVVAALLLVSLLVIRDRKITPRMLRNFPANGVVLFIGSVIAIAGYTAFYRYNAQSIQLWYSANIVLPCFTVLAVAFTLVEKTGPRFRLAFNAYLIFFVLLNLVVVNMAGSPWPHQTAMLKAGKTLRAMGPEQRVAAWNAGIIGFYQGGRVINIDGLVNDDIYPYLKTNSLHRYLSEKHISYIADFESMLADESLAVRGGYEGDVLKNSIEAVVFKVPGAGKYWHTLNLYRLNTEKL